MDSLDVATSAATSPTDLDVTAVRAAVAAGTPLHRSTMIALCDALDAARAEVRSREGDAARMAKRLVFAETARDTAVVERGRVILSLTCAQAECHAVIKDECASEASKEIARSILAASRRGER